MLVYGDAVRHERAADKLDRIAAVLDRATATAPGLGRHSMLVTALIEAGELAQGIADRAFAEDGFDRATPPADAAMALTLAIARRCGASWLQGFAGDDDADRPALVDAVDRCRALFGVERLETRQPEGYAFYLLYPESYLVAARALRADRTAAGWQVIGVRSIGTSLSCMVAVGLGADRPITVRPGGPPFGRSVDADPALIDRSAEAFAVVDEGPGLSGSSLAAVARWLTAQGIAERRIHFFPSHPNGPGPQAGAETLALWARAAGDRRVHVTSFDALVLHSAVPAHRLDRWVRELVGPLRAPLDDIGGGVWRERQRRDPSAAQPPAHPWQERRKFIATGADGREWLVKFNGLGTPGSHKVARARSLGEAGWSPMPLGECHGFLVERWLGDAAPLPERPAGSLRETLIERIGGYLAFRARHFDAADASGADLAALHAMARHNTEQALGQHAAAAAWHRWAPTLPQLEASVRRVETDNRMQHWEWLPTAQGIVKTDAVDHHAGHDLVGCQDIAWDIAAASVELALTDAEERRLIATVEARAAIAVSPTLVVFGRACYAAFQLGYYDEAARSADPAGEAPRLLATRARYAERLRTLLGAETFTPPR